MTFWEEIFWGNTYKQWAMAVGTVLVVLIAIWILKSVIIMRFARFAVKSQTDAAAWAAGVASKTRMFLLAFLAIYAGSQMLELPGAWSQWIGTLAVIALLIQTALWGNALITTWLTYYQKKHLETDASRVTTIRAAGFVLRLVLYSIVVLLALDNIPGIEVSALIASMGIGGIAVALAVQSILADLFASLSIAFDKPFVIGDFIIVGDFLGTVEHIGLKTTRIRSLSGEQLVLSNNDLLSSRIRNYKSLEERRVVFSIGVTYETPKEKVETIPVMIREIIESHEATRFDRAHFKSFGDFALNFEVVYYVLSADYTAYMDIQQAINLTLMERFEREKIGFAYPTQTIHVSGDVVSSGFGDSP